MTDVNYELINGIGTSSQIDDINQEWQIDVDMAELDTHSDPQGTDTMILDEDGTAKKTTVDALLANVVFPNKPNIAINSDGTNPINQRGIADTDALTTGQYTIDRWYVTHDCTAVNFENSNGGSGIIFTDVTAGTAAEYAQKAESFAQYQGKTLSLSMSVTSNNSCTIFIDDGVGTTSSTAHSGSGTETLTVTRAIDGSATKLEFGIALVVSVNNYAEFEWVNLVECDVPTTWTVPDPQQELARCQRYFERISSNATYTRYGGGIALSTTVAQISIPYNTTKRSTYTIASSGTFGLFDGSSTFTVTAIALNKVGDSIANIQFTVASGLTASQFYEVLDNNDAAAYIDISCEL